MDPLDQLRSRFSGLRLREETTAGRVYAGQDGTGNEVTIAVLTGPAATDPAARDAFADVVWRHSVGAVPGRATVASADLHAVFPWAATRTPPGQAGAEQLLAGVPVPPVSPAVGGSRLARLSQPGSPWPWLLGAAAGVVLVLAVVLAIGGVQWLRGAGAGQPAAGATTVPPTAAGSPSAGTPVVRPATPVSVVGPTFAPGDETYPVALGGWPFAFRAPPDWSCFPEPLDDIPQGAYWLCRDRIGSDSQQLLAVFLWECPTTCTPAEQQEMAQTWLDEPERAVRLGDSPTVYVETATNVQGLYTVDLATFTSERQGAPLRWLVGVYIESPFGTRATMQKVLNDIVSQAAA